MPADEQRTSAAPTASGDRQPASPLSAPEAPQWRLTAEEAVQVMERASQEWDDAMTLVSGVVNRLTGIAAALQAEQLDGVKPEMRREIQRMQQSLAGDALKAAKLGDMGQFSTFLERAVGTWEQVVAMREMPKCPDCGHYHPANQHEAAPAAPPIRQIFSIPHEDDPPVM